MTFREITTDDVPALFEVRVATRENACTSIDPTLRAYGFYRKLGWTDHEIRDGLRFMKKFRPGGVVFPVGPE